MRNLWRKTVPLVLILSLIIGGVPISVLAAQYVTVGVEVLVNPIGNDVDLEYIAITNDGEEVLDLSSWTFLRGATPYTFPIVIAVGQTAYLCANTNTEENGGLDCAADLGAFTLVNTGGSFKMISPFDKEMLEVVWDDLSVESNDPIIASFDDFTGIYQIDLNPLDDSYIEGTTVFYSGLVDSVEGDSQSVLVRVIAGANCDGEVVSEVINELTSSEEFYNFEGSFTTGLAGIYSVAAGLIDDGEEVPFLVAACQNFEVTEDIRPEGILTIEKITEGYESDWAFDFTGIGTGFTLSSDMSDDGMGRLASFNVPVGNISLGEEKTPYWEMTGVDCWYEVAEKSATSDSEASSPLISANLETGEFVVNVSESDPVYCVVTNTYTPPPVGYLTINKEVIGYDDAKPWSFDFTSSETDINFTLSKSDEYSKDTDNSVYLTVLSGVNTFTEARQKNWKMSDVSCEFEYIYGKVERDEETFEEFVLATPEVLFNEDDQSFSVDVPEDTSVVCTVTNTYSKSKSGGKRTKKPTLPNVLPAETVGLSTTTSSCSLLLSSYMKMGWNNDKEEVIKLQTFLNKYGFVVPVTGYFGPLTEAAVKDFQKQYLIDVLVPWGIDYGTGFVFKTTRYKINNMHCKGSELMPVL